MKTFLFIHWNICYDYTDGNREYKINHNQKMNLYFINKYRNCFDKVLVVIHTDDIHDIYSTHLAKREFDKIFGNNVSFITEKNKGTITDSVTFEKHFLPLINAKIPEYDMYYYIHNKGFSCNQTPSMDLWISSLYYLNFENQREIYDLLDKDDSKFITGGILFNFDFNNISSLPHYYNPSNEPLILSWHFTGAFFGIYAKRYKQKVFKNEIDTHTNVRGNAEQHFGTFIDKNYVVQNPRLNEILFDKTVYEKLNPYTNFSNIILAAVKEEYNDDIMNINTLKESAKQWSM